MSDFRIDPNTRDYEVSKGQYNLTDDLGNNIYLSLMIRKGTWLFDPEFGSRLYLLEREKALDRIAKKALEYCNEALKWILDSGRAESIDVTVELDKANSRLNCLIKATRKGVPATYGIYIQVR